MDGGAEPGAAWRVILLTDVGGEVVPLVQQMLGGFGHRLIAVVTGPGPKRRRSDDYLDVVRSAPPEVDVIVTTRMGRLATLLAPLAPDLILSTGFKWRVPPAVLALPPLGVVNFHLGLLPERRGPNPVGWAFREDDPAVGLTVHRMDEGFDTGPILAQSRVPVGDDDDFASLFPRVLATAGDAFARAFARVARGDPGDPQDESRAFYAELFADDWREIDWSRPARAVHNQVRSWYGGRGTPRGAFATLDGARVLVTRTRLLAGDAPPFAPGATARRDDGILLVGCGDGPLAIVAWEPAGT